MNDILWVHELERLDDLGRVELSHVLREVLALFDIGEQIAVWTVREAEILVQNNNHDKEAISKHKWGEQELARHLTKTVFVLEGEAELHEEMVSLQVLEQDLLLQVHILDLLLPEYLRFVALFDYQPTNMLMLK